MTSRTALDHLQQLLADAEAEVRFGEAAPARSSLSDPTYFACLAALALKHLGTRRPGEVRVYDRKLRFGQFVASRPVLLPEVVGASGGQRSTPMPSGYVNEPTIVKTEEYLIAAGLLLRDGSDLIAIDEGQLLRLAVQLRHMDLFRGEEEVLQKIGKLHITKKALGDY